MISFCPLIKEQCKGNECVMWKNESCILVTYLSGYEGENSTELPNEEPMYDEIESISAEELAAEIVTFAQREFPDEKMSFALNVATTQILHDKKIVNRFTVPLEINLKIQKAQMLAEKQFEAKEKEKLVLEKKELPSIVDACYDWARSQGLAKLTLGEVEVFLAENDRELLKQSKKLLWSMVNVKLKTR